MQHKKSKKTKYTKLAFQIFAITYCLFLLVIGGGSFFLLNQIYLAQKNERIARAENDNRNLYTYVMRIYVIYNESYVKYFVNEFARRLGSDGDTAMVGDYEELCEAGGISDTFLLPEKEQVITRMEEREDGTYVTVLSRCEDLYILNRYSFSDILRSRNENFRMYRGFLVVVSVLSGIILYIFSRYIAKPIANLTKMAEKVALGDYSLQIDAEKMKTAEMVQLAQTMNSLTKNTGRHIEELEDMIEKREVFMADFTHEIKTPLTSIIGYGDILRTYDVSPGKRREYGEYIYFEGKRLESLSLNLLQLIVLNKEQFAFSAVSVCRFMENVKKGTRFLEQKYHVFVEFSVENGNILIEPSLFATAILNLIDNACKASEEGQTVLVRGRNLEIGERGSEKQRTGGYQFIVADWGRGIDAEHLDRLTEPFYMVDKSRARKQGGAGLGLSLVDRIVKLHKGIFEIKSRKGSGTSAMITLWEKEGDR